VKLNGAPGSGCTKYCRNARFAVTATSIPKKVRFPSPNVTHQTDKLIECDLGKDNRAPNSGCTKDCKICPFCGDGHQDLGEGKCPGSTKPLLTMLILQLVCDLGSKNGEWNSGCSKTVLVHPFVVTVR
jgi:hypothetical protein